MYRSFYGLNEKPFNLTPDPRFLFLSEKHKEAFAHLTYGINNRSGFIMISGEIGTGKTTICRSLLAQLDADTEVAFIFNPYLSPEELLRKINEDFGIKSRGRTVKALIDELNEFLLARAGEGKNCVLVIDEAQNLDPPVLEQIRLLSNLETEKEKLLQIVLIGQPELAEKLELNELRQLNQRITARYHLRALSYRETIQYVAYRLRVAGGRRKVRFSRGAMRAVYSCSKGTPRVINSTCDRALLIGYTKEAHEISRAIVRQAAKEIRGEKRARRRRWNPLEVSSWSPFVIAAAAAVIGVVLLTAGPFTWTPRSEPGDAPAAVEERVSLGQPNLARATVEEPLAAKAGAETVAVARAGTAIEAKEAADSTPGPLAKRAETAVAKVKPRSELDRILSGLTPVQTHAEALSAMLREWNMALLAGLPRDASVESTTRWATSIGLSVEHLTPTLDEVLTINLPALVQMDGARGLYWLALVGAEADSVLVTVGGGEVQAVSHQAFNELYTGKAVLLWLDPTPSVDVLRLGDRGGRVSALQEGLLRLGLFPGQVSGTYDRRTAETITQIQTAAGVLVDGVVGKQTRMVLTSWLRDTPSLTGESFPALARARVVQALRAAGLLPKDVLIVGQAAEVDSEPLRGAALEQGDWREPQLLAETAPPRVTADTGSAEAALVSGTFSSRKAAPGTVLVEELAVSANVSSAQPRPRETRGEVTSPASGGHPIVPRPSGDAGP